MIASLIIALHLSGIITLESAVSSLYIAGILLIIAELGVISFGLIAFNGLIALYAAYALQLGGDYIFGIPIGWSALFGVAFVELAVIVTVIFVYIWLRKQKHATGIESMIGEKTSIVEWKNKIGLVNFEGEIWKAKSNKSLELNKGDEAIINSVNKLELTITT